MDSPFFEPRISVFDDPDENKSAHDSNHEESPTFCTLRDATSPSGGQSSSSRNEHEIGRARTPITHETPSPSSGNLVTILKNLLDWGEMLYMGCAPCVYSVSIWCFIGIFG